MKWTAYKTAEQDELKTYTVHLDFSHLKELGLNDVDIITSIHMLCDKQHKDRLKWKEDIKQYKLDNPDLIKKIDDINNDILAYMELDKTRPEGIIPIVHKVMPKSMRE